MGSRPERTSFTANQAPACALGLPLQRLPQRGTLVNDNCTRSRLRGPVLLAGVTVMRRLRMTTRRWMIVVASRDSHRGHLRRSIHNNDAGRDGNGKRALDSRRSSDIPRPWATQTVSLSTCPPILWSRGRHSRKSKAAPATTWRSRMDPSGSSPRRSIPRCSRRSRQPQATSNYLSAGISRTKRVTGLYDRLACTRGRNRSVDDAQRRRPQNHVDRAHSA